jgi:putative ABC transport system permease protein
MNSLALLFTSSFVLLTLLLSLWQRLDLERDLLVGTIRAVVQLLAVGYLLQMIFDMQHWFYMALMIAIMLLVAAHNASRRGKEIRGSSFFRVLLALLLTETVALVIVLCFGIIPPKPQFIIPLSGMFIGNAMVAAGLFLNRLQAEIDSRRYEVLTALSLGANSRQAGDASLRLAVKASMIPTIDSLKTVGLVQLPGMMTGLIIAGVSPVEAVRYQILIMFSMTAVAGVTSICLGLLTLPALFSTDHRLLFQGQPEHPSGS